MEEIGKNVKIIYSCVTQWKKLRNVEGLRRISSSEKKRYYGFFFFR